MAFTWSAALETGHITIDSQHKELVKAVNDLLTACKDGQGADKVNATLNFLVSYTKRHFGEEEKLQEKSSYPDLPNHRKLHEGFVKVVADLSTELKQTGPTPIAINKIVRNIGDWLVNHIQKEDAKIAAHIKKMGQ
ncbi:MAG: hemerythrin family protein [Chitinispirillales bacterium]|jgi:hemerythrin|nr:hemerythrin family protein [Chitinispirillales bacterium]